MFVFIHLIVGIIIGSVFSSAFLVGILALISHFLLDFIPHWDSGFDKEYFERTGKARITKQAIGMISFDFILAILVIILFWYYASVFHLEYSRVNVVLGSFMSILPDLLWIGYLTEFKKEGIFHNYLKFHHKVHEKGDSLDWKIRVIVQAMFLIAFILSLILLMYV